MKFAAAFILAGLAALAQAVQLTNSAFDVQAGKQFKITWSEAVGNVKLTLKNGDPKDLKDVTVIVAAVPGTAGEYVWSVPTTLPSDTYAIEIVDSTGVPNYSLPFNFVGSTTARPSSASATVTSTSSPSSSEATTSAATTSSAHTSSSQTTRTSSTRTTNPTAATTVPGAGNRLGSPAALIVLTIAAMLYFH